MNQPELYDLVRNVNQSPKLYDLVWVRSEIPTPCICWKIMDSWPTNIRGWVVYHESETPIYHSDLLILDINC